MKGWGFGASLVAVGMAGAALAYLARITVALEEIARCTP